MSAVFLLLSWFCTSCDQMSRGVIYSFVCEIIPQMFAIRVGSSSGARSVVVGAPMTTTRGVRVFVQKASSTPAALAAPQLSSIAAGSPGPLAVAQLELVRYSRLSDRAGGGVDTNHQTERARKVTRVLKGTIRHEFSASCD